MSRPMVSVRNPETRKRTMRAMNDEEFAQWELDTAQAIAGEEQRRAKEKEHKDKSKKLTKELAKLVDLTESEIAELLRLNIDDD